MSVFLDVWKLDIWNAGLYSHGHHCYIEGKVLMSMLYLAVNM